MSALLIDLTDAVVDELNDHSFSMDLIAERTYLPQFELKQFSELRVSVVPREQRTERLTRESCSEICGIDVGVQMRFAKQDAICIDPLMSLVDEILNHFNGLVFSGTGALCTAIKPSPVYSPEHMEQFRQFTSVLTLTIKVMP